MSEIVHRARAAVSKGADFKSSVRPSRPFITSKEAFKVAAPLMLLATTAISCGTQTGVVEATPIAMETPKPLSDLIAEQSQAGIPFQGYNTGESRKGDDFIQEQTSAYGEFKGSTAIIGLDANNSQIMSEMFAFEKGVFVVFYNAEGNAVSEMSPVSVNYGYDNNNNLSMIYKADVGDGDGGENITPFLTLTSNTTIDNLDSQILAKAQAGDQETLADLAQYFDDPGEIIALSYSNPQTHQQINVDSQSSNWGDKIKNVLQALNPFAVNPVHAAPADTATPEATATIPPPAINESVKTAVGEAEYSEIQTGTVKAKDYSTGKDFDGTVEASSVKAVSTADMIFPNIVTAEAVDGNGNKFNVVWNPETNNWVRVTEVNTNLTNYTKDITLQNIDVWTEDLLKYTNYTHFENIDKMVESGDLNLVLLAQGIGSEAFPTNTEAARYGLGVNTSVTGGPLDYFAYLNLMKADYTIPDDKINNLDYRDFRNGGFTKGSEAYKTSIGIEGTTSDSKSVIGIVQVFQNADKTNFTVPLVFDPKQFLFLFTANEGKDAYGNDGMERLVLENTFKFTPIIPTDNPSDWNNEKTAGGSNAGSHLVSFAGLSFKNDVVIPMQTPGEGFKFIPDDLQQLIRDNVLELRNGGYGPGKSFLFQDGKVPFDLAKFLSRNLNDVAATDGSLQQP